MIDPYRVLGVSQSASEEEIKKAFSRMVIIRLDIEHLTGKEAIELVRQRQA